MSQVRSLILASLLAFILPEAIAVATQLAALPPNAVGLMKRALAACAVTDLRAALAIETDATVAGMMDPATLALVKDF